MTPHTTDSYRASHASNADSHAWCVLVSIVFQSFAISRDSSKCRATSRRTSTLLRLNVLKVVIDENGCRVYVRWRISLTVNKRIKLCRHIRFHLYIDHANPRHELSCFPPHINELLPNLTLFCSRICLPYHRMTRVFHIIRAHSSVGHL